MSGHYISADVGGTFTDLVLYDTAAGRVLFEKTLSTPGRADGVIDGLEKITVAAGLSVHTLERFVHGFTIATNAYLTRTGARVVLLVTDGFGDVLEIREQLRPYLYRLTQEKPPSVVPRQRVVEVQERVDAFGKIHTPLDAAIVDTIADKVVNLQPEAIAICLTFAHLNPEHEQLLEVALRERLPDVPVYLSTRVNPQIEEYPRTQTTAIAAYVGPLVASYVAALEAGLGEKGYRAPLLLLRSDGGVSSVGGVRGNPAHMLLSGPAGGVIASAGLCAATGVPDVVTFDMGGTSADFSVIIDGRPGVVATRTVDGQPLRVPMMDIETISAGGGSVAWVDHGGGLQIGPQSAGAVPGPACYALGGERATVTDAGVVLGLIHPDDYLGGAMHINSQFAQEAIQRDIAAPLSLGVEEAAYGVVAVANAKMVQAIRAVSSERGHDVRRFSLLAFGGAGPVFASHIASMLGMREVVVPLRPGVFSAAGMLQTDLLHAVQRPFAMPVSGLHGSTIIAQIEEMRAELVAMLAGDGVSETQRYFEFSADCRCVGQFHELAVPLGGDVAPGVLRLDNLDEVFHECHQKRYGHSDAEVAVEIVNLRAVGGGRTPKLTSKELATAPTRTPVVDEAREVYLGREKGFTKVPVHRRSNLLAGHEFCGPAIVTQSDSTVVVLAGQTAKVLPDGTLSLRFRDPQETSQL